jgi:hypothetical protein
MGVACMGVAKAKQNKTASARTAVRKLKVDDKFIENSSLEIIADVRYGDIVR